jgi:hypothetical protein
LHISTCFSQGSRQSFVIFQTTVQANHVGNSGLQI